LSFKSRRQATLLADFPDRYFGVGRYVGPIDWWFLFWFSLVAIDGIRCESAGHNTTFDGHLIEAGVIDERCGSG
jgi:hypothetical protein